MARGSGRAAVALALLLTCACDGGVGRALAPTTAAPVAAPVVALPAAGVNPIVARLARLPVCATGQDELASWLAGTVGVPLAAGPFAEAAADAPAPGDLVAACTVSGQAAAVRGWAAFDGDGTLVARSKGDGMVGRSSVCVSEEELGSGQRVCTTEVPSETGFVADGPGFRITVERRDGRPVLPEQLFLAALEPLTSHEAFVLPTTAPAGMARCSAPRTSAVAGNAETTVAYCDGARTVLARHTESFSGDTPPAPAPGSASAVVGRHLLEILGPLDAGFDFGAMLASTPALAEHAVRPRGFRTMADGPSPEGAGFGLRLAAAGARNVTPIAQAEPQPHVVQLTGVTPDGHAFDFVGRATGEPMPAALVLGGDLVVERQGGDAVLGHEGASGTTRLDAACGAFRYHFEAAAPDATLLGLLTAVGC